MTLITPNRPIFPPGEPPRFVAYADVADHMDNWNRIPAFIYGCPSGRWVNHPSSGRLIRYDKLTPHWKGVYDRTAGWTPSTRTWNMGDSEAFVSPIDGSYISGRAARRDHIKRHDLIEYHDIDRSQPVADRGYVEPDEREIEEAMFVAKQQLEQGFRPDEDEENTDEFGYTRQWMEREQHLREGGYQ